ncbi:MAG: hypothetical protein JXQ75_16630 [Phycisphaerae bacterium]|nr:hypothetical protein [Phycisphaerae bacterium]
MTRSLLLVALCTTLLGMTCPGSSSLICSNDLDGSEFGFVLTIPDEFECTTPSFNPFPLAQVRYQQSSAGITVSVQVSRPSTDEEDLGEEVTTEDLGNITNSNGVLFEREKVTFVSDSISLYGYVGGATLASGNHLFITVANQSDAPSMAETLDTIIESVQWVEPSD